MILLDGGSVDPLSAPAPGPQFAESASIGALVAARVGFALATCRSE